MIVVVSTSVTPVCVGSLGWTGGCLLVVVLGIWVQGRPGWPRDSSRIDSFRGRRHSAKCRRLGIIRAPWVGRTQCGNNLG